MDRCDECRFDYYGFARPEIADRLRASAADHVERLTETPAAFLRERPLPGWSALEYGCHVRDVLVVQAERIDQAQREDSPEFVPMGRDERAVDDPLQRPGPADRGRPAHRRG